MYIAHAMRSYHSFNLIITYAELYWAEHPIYLIATEAHRMTRKKVFYGIYSSVFFCVLPWQSYPSLSD